jgi:hypothetical protein
MPSTLPPRARRQTSIDDSLRVEGRLEAEGSSAHSLSSQKVDRKNPWVGLLARKERIDNNRFAGRFTFPGRSTEWLFEATRLHSQWRDRAGLTPDFPFMPSWAPKASVDASTCHIGYDRILRHHEERRAGREPAAAELLAASSLRGATTAAL